MNTFPINALSATAPSWQDAEHTTLLMAVQFEHLAEPVPFTASPDDVEPHGRWLFALARDGAFGPVAEYVPPTPLEVAARDNPPARQKAMVQATASAQHHEIMGEAEQMAAWRSYYRELYALGTHPDWPLVTQWPAAPSH
ncbi:hypothetical protein [Aeromonas sp. sif2433]|uniref:hypothetical protein n=1 Tax=Aeromonas sp. sif2433 TaxID=2854794 RepID=UPI001C4751C4|nr:hypothetical protein [Aeromonas sp. sif2433]MBV7413617.1 hypothetical protein [Aeromonas sp. sif2433]